MHACCTDGSHTGFQRTALPVSAGKVNVGIYIRSNMIGSHGMLILHLLPRQLNQELSGMGRP
jgi:hypothetical protein